ncbi:ribokinase [Gorillibacterium timonense]|uniref:ribokinase n=1 Tax=Gorillibacterium timonense TaxID=1689269 RepID=UPI00071DF14F|nr:ribokinase [Gorillibacterium timonense]
MNRPRIAVVGSLNMDLVVTAERMPQTGETLTGESIHSISGGKGANQAVACARLGAQVDLIGAVGDDTFGSSLLAELKKSGVSTDTVSRLTDTATGIASILHTRQDNSIVVVPGANGKVSAELVERSADTIRQADVLLVQLEIPLDAVKAALRIAQSAGVRTVLNPAPARSLPREMLLLADYFTPNETEFAFFNRGYRQPLPSEMQNAPSGSPLSDHEQAATVQADSGQGADDWQAALSEWAQHYGHTVILTRGREGASYLHNGAPVTVPAPIVQAVDTTGAGDCLNGAFGFGLASGWSVEHSLQFAVKAASLSVTKFGAQAGMPTFAEVSRWT